VNPQPSQTEPSTVWVRRGRVCSITVYDVKDSELDILEKGGVAETTLTFATLLLTLGMSALFCLAATTITNSLMKTIVAVVMVTGLVGGVFLLVVWFQTRKSIAKVVKTIRDRLLEETTTPPEPDKHKPKIVDAGPEEPAG
jgi:hypothetical protein